MKLTSEDKRVVEAALRSVTISYRESAETMANVAKCLREGQKVPIFADGEPGAVAADRLAKEFERQRKDAERVLNKIESAEDDLRV